MMKVRKQVYLLTEDDLRDHEVWEFALDEEGVEGQDEATVRPFSPQGELDASSGMFVLRASFRLADGSRMSGYLTPPAGSDSGLGTIQPVIVSASGQVTFWQGIRRPQRTELDDWYRRLGRTASQLFPLEFNSEVPLVRGPVRGTIPGFLVVQSLGNGKVEVIK